MPIESVEHEPTRPLPRVPGDLRAVDLVTEDDGGKSILECRPKAAPSALDFGGRFVGPQSEAEIALAGGDPGRHPVPGGPLGELQPGDAGVLGAGFPEHGRLSGPGADPASGPHSPRA